MLRDLRSKMGLTQNKLSELSGLSTNFISFCERGIEQPSLNSIWLLSSAMKIEPTELVRLVQDQNPIPNY
ncbi:helix-turn-helix domain-containing protein [Pelagicoccus sp. SDUM812002]|uniref:helix-turn-helix domain-containing protein n=1 Tax=Pelagicoccus sp. SDUM812002 TaxID=3041266 RepID=UPI0034E213F3